MGLPLFVAPVESDLPSKSKTTTTSPPRSTIRRSAYHHGSLRDRPNATLARRARLMEIHERRRPMSRALEALVNDTSSSGMVAAAEYIRNGFMSPDELSRPTERNYSGQPERTSRSERRNQDWDGSRRDARSQWWMFQPHARPENERLNDRLVMLGLAGGEPSSIDRRALRASDRWFPSSSRDRAHQNGDTPASTTQRVPVPDDHGGLGDRNRSVSPEGWDTLLSTLTPDPQPPSANSSFVSNSASVPGGSFTSSSQAAQPGSVPEPPCESGCENSDTEEGDSIPRRRHRVRRTATRSGNPVRFLVPDFTTYGSGRQTPWGDTDSAAPVRSSRPDNNLVDIYTASRPTLLGGPRDGWVGQLSVGASDENSGLDVPRPQPESSSSFASIVSASSSAEEDLTSLQRIVRSLASREDIPDEWWTETGLSRTLTRDRS